jgi:hypothetical protein
LVAITSASSTQQTSQAFKAPNNNELDEADLFWKSREKYFLVVAASQTFGTSNDLPFTNVDADRVSETFKNAGYEMLDVLKGPRASHDDFVEQLQRIRNKPKNALVIVYYSGHAAIGPKGKDLCCSFMGRNISEITTDFQSAPW